MLPPLREASCTFLRKSFRNAPRRGTRRTLTATLRRANAAPHGPSGISTVIVSGPAPPSATRTPGAGGGLVRAPPMVKTDDHTSRSSPDSTGRITSGVFEASSRRMGITCCRRWLRSPATTERQKRWIARRSPTPCRGRHEAAHPPGHHSRTACSEGPPNGDLAIPCLWISCTSALDAWTC